MSFQIHPKPLWGRTTLSAHRKQCFSGIYGGFAISQRADVGIGPYNGARVQNTTRIRIIYTIVPPAMDKSILTATNSRLPP